MPWHPLEEWASVTAFGLPRTLELVHQKSGKKQKVEDWSEALQRAIDSGAKTVYFPPGKGGYGIYGPVRLRGNVERIIGCEVPLGKVVESTEHATVYQPESRTVFILEDGAAPAVVVERFDTWYGAPRFEQRSKRALVIASMSFYELDTQPGTGHVFLEDVRCNNVTVRGSKLWGRQVNAEGHEDARIVNDGGQTWILGLKTENDPTIARIANGGISEFLGGFIYANKNHVPDKLMFINDNSTVSLTIGESVTRRGKAFPVIVEEIRGGEKRQLKKGDTPPRGPGSMVPLYVGGAE